MAGFIVREATEDDVEAMLDVYESVAAEGRWIGGELPIDRERHRVGRLERIQGGATIGVAFVAEADGRIVGDLGLHVVRGRADLGMALLEGYRGIGIGSALMEAAIAWARAHELDKIALEVWPHNERAIALYEKFGFVREGYHPKEWRRRSGGAWDTISMGLVL